MTTPPGQPPNYDPADRDQSGWPPPPPHQPYQPGNGPGTGPGTGPQPTQAYDSPGYGYPQQPAYGQPGYPQPAYGTGYPVGGGYPPDAAAPFGYDAMGRPFSDKQKLVAGLLGIFLGGFGVGRFYTGHTGLGIAQLAVTLVTCGFGSLWGLIDGILILVNGGTDAQGRPLRD